MPALLYCNLGGAIAALWPRWLGADCIAELTSAMRAEAQANSEKADLPRFRHPAAALRFSLKQTAAADVACGNAFF